MSAVVCEEVFDETTAKPPTADEIKTYALRIGIDPDSEPQLLPLANEGLMKPLPPGWVPCYSEINLCYYYFNSITGKTQWEHPLDEVYRGLVKKVRSETQSLSVADVNNTEDATFNVRDDMPSLEETPAIEAKSSDALGAKKKQVPVIAEGENKRVTPKLSKQRSEEQSTTFRKHLNMFNSFDEKIKLVVSPSVESKEVGKKNDDKNAECQPRSILRDRNFLEPSKSMEFDKSTERSDREDDDKKSVRFNLDNTTDACLTFSEKSSSEDDLKEQKDKPVEVVKSRFTVSPVLEFENVEIAAKKVIKPYPKDLVTPVLKICKNSDSEDESDKKQSNSDNSASTEEKIAKSVTEVRLKAERKIKEIKQTIWEEKNRELESFKEDMHESHKKELERILIEEKTRHEERIKTELESLRLEMENRATGTLKLEKERLEEELEIEKKELQLRYQIQKDDFEAAAAKVFEEEKEKLQISFDDKLLKLAKDLEEKFQMRHDEMILTHSAVLEQLKENHSIIMEELKKEFMAEEHVLRREHQNQMAELRAKMAKEADGKAFEKLKCEKKLLEDKYRCLKDKYLRLKTDVKLSIEKRNKKKEQSGTTTTGSETEKSHSVNKEKKLNPDKPPTPKTARSKPTRQLIIQDLDTSASDRSYRTDDYYNNKNEDSSEGNLTNPGRSRKKMFSRLKSSSTSRINNNSSKSRKSQRSCSPVENLRRQLQKLEDLEDQIPPNPQPDTYHLRYPFEGRTFEGASSELEFFRHRIHLERDSIKRAKESLRNQKSLFQQRQKELKLKHGSMARHTLQQLCQEEKELTDMEVSLHRTRSLLGEKVIRLRHLEQSLHRATSGGGAGDQSRPSEDATLSDLSSHSASSGISSTEFATGENPMMTAGKGIIRGENFQESSEIIQSLENLNSEIREIWEVLYKQQQHTGGISAAPPVSPFSLVYPDPGWPVISSTAAGASATLPSAPPSIPTLADRLHNYRRQVALANAQSTVVVTNATQGATTTLVERTRNLRHWLRQAGAAGAQAATDNGGSVMEGNGQQADL